MAAVGSNELSLEDSLRRAALDYLARGWGFDSWRTYVTFDLDAARGTGTAESRKVSDLVTAVVNATLPVVNEQLGILETENEDLQGELNDVRQVLAELGVPANPALSLRRHVKRVIRELRGDLAVAVGEHDELEHARRVLAVFEDWWKEDVGWRVGEDGVRFFALCSDVFWWGSADGEDIRPEDLELLERCKADLVALEGHEPTCLPELYAARKRGMRPQGAWYAGVDSSVHHLFDECGPAREVGLGNPRRHPSEER